LGFLSAGAQLSAVLADGRSPIRRPGYCDSPVTHRKRSVQGGDARRKADLAFHEPSDHFLGLTLVDFPGVLALCFDQSTLTRCVPLFGTGATLELLPTSARTLAVSPNGLRGYHLGRSNAGSTPSRDCENSRRHNEGLRLRGGEHDPQGAGSVAAERMSSVRSDSSRSSSIWLPETAVQASPSSQFC